jgi:peptidylprolyl isomerase
MKLYIKSLLIVLFIYSALSAAAGTNSRIKILITTSLGNIEAELYNETPLHRDNFIKLAETSFYDSILFHRVIKGFMVQGGDPQSKNAPKGKLLGNGGPNYTLPAEIRPEFAHTRGALSAARLADAANPAKESSGSQFYIVTGSAVPEENLRRLETRRQQLLLSAIIGRYLADSSNIAHKEEMQKYKLARDYRKIDSLGSYLIGNKIDTSGISYSQELIANYTASGGAPHLDGDYTVFGQVTGGWEVLEKIETAITDRSDRPLEDIRILSVTLINEPPKNKRGNRARLKKQKTKE